MSGGSRGGSTPKGPWGIISPHVKGQDSPEDLNMGLAVAGSLSLWPPHRRGLAVAVVVVVVGAGGCHRFV
jgi:hypothetical protein